VLLNHQIIQKDLKRMHGADGGKDKKKFNQQFLAAAEEGEV